jgi:hypothetical protein
MAAPGAEFSERQTVKSEDRGSRIELADMKSRLGKLPAQVAKMRPRGAKPLGIGYWKLVIEKPERKRFLPF